MIQDDKQGTQPILNIVVHMKLEERIEGGDVGCESNRPGTVADKKLRPNERKICLKVQILSDDLFQQFF